MDNYLSLIYIDFIKRNSAELIRNIVAECAKTKNILRNIIFDDFLRSHYQETRKNPIKAIIDFLKNYEHQITILLINYQIIIKKK